ncbi:endolytic transglycosylase MltG [Bacillus sp. FJAT-50079]|uniref:endolytic transglycosylase MltG n=1 Tax=Bacillus sp. FJAT-50079 TaxID=2833577 RepID=UPI001BC8CCEC|nr:endolytic transglycosylase MltG [Bacillus sp. FJAT-50079]MBS4209595.1 endolytic transglycosylase MltG [Bacillus sp. FJAT-50079]
MDKQTTRGLAAGLFLAALILIIYHSFFAKEEKIAKQPDPDYIEVKLADYERIVEQEKEWREKYESLLAEKEPVKQDDVEPKIITFKLDIVEGMSSKEISKQLEDAGVIDSSEQFNAFLGEKELQRYIQIGTFQLDNTMTNEQIAKMITKE